MRRTKLNNIKIYKNVKIGPGAIIEPGVIIGLPPFGKKAGELSTYIGRNAYLRHNTVIYAGVSVGDNFQTGPNVLIREFNSLGDNVVVWHNTTLNPENKIGSNTRIHAGCFLEKVILEENVFIAPNVTFTDDPHPIVPINYRECWGGAIVGKGAVIGGNVTILPNIKIGQFALVGAGSVVTKDVPAYKLVTGNPAKIKKNIIEISCKKGNHKPYLKFKKEK